MCYRGLLGNWWKPGHWKKGPGRDPWVSFPWDLANTKYRQRSRVRRKEKIYCLGVKGLGFNHSTLCSWSLWGEWHTLPSLSFLHSSPAPPPTLSLSLTHTPFLAHYSIRLLKVPLLRYKIRIEEINMVFQRCFRGFQDLWTSSALRETPPSPLNQK